MCSIRILSKHSVHINNLLRDTHEYLSPQFRTQPPLTSDSVHEDSRPQLSSPASISSAEEPQKIHPARRTVAGYRL